MAATTAVTAAGDGTLHYRKESVRSGMIGLMLEVVVEGVGRGVGQFTQLNFLF